MLKRISVAVLFLGVSLLAFGQTQKSGPKQDPNAVEMRSLQAKYQAAMQEYYKPVMNAKTPEEAAKIKLDPAKSPNPVYLPKFRALAMRAGKTKPAFDAWAMVAQLGEQIPDLKAEDQAVDTIVKDFSDSEWITEFVQMLPNSNYSLPAAQRAEKIEGILTSIEAKTSHDSVKAAALYARAQIASQAGKSDAAANLYRDVVAKFPNSEQAKAAKGDIFEMENLVVGKTAPDFDAEDQDGVKFKLSDYRGKVVVLDFWGFW